MADDRVLLLLSPRELECAVCHGRYKEPCTLPCGHTYCRGCIEEYWRTKGQRMCPMCNKPFSKKLELNKNITLDALLEAWQEQGIQCQDSCPDCTGPGAAQLCLPCMAPLCQQHLSSHRDPSPNHRRHLLVALQNASCPEHRRARSTFCIAHSALVCSDCAMQDHTNCRTEPLLQRYRANRDRLEKTIGQLDQEIARLEEEIARQKDAAHQVQIMICDMKDALIRDFWDMRNYLEQQERACLQQVEREKEKAQHVTAQELQVLKEEGEHLKKLKSELQDRLDNDCMAVLMQSEDNTRPLSSVRTPFMFDPDCLMDVTETITNIKKSLLSLSFVEQPPNQPEDSPSSPVSEASPSASQDAAPDTNLTERERNLQCATSLTFDQTTVHPRLRLSNDRKTVTVAIRNGLYWKSDRRFTTSQVTCVEDFSRDRAYWEISTAGSDSWAIGVVAAEMGRDGQLGRNPFSWCVEWNKGRLSAWHNCKDQPLEHQRPLTVGVLLECPDRRVTFYSVSADGLTSLHSCQVKIFSTLFPAVWLLGLNPENSLTIRDLQSPTV